MSLRNRRGYPTRMAAPQRSRTGGAVGALLILLLLIAIGVLGMLFIRTSAYQTNAKQQFVDTIQAECASAVALSRNMSLTAGASSYEALAKIRSNIYAMETINEMNLALEGPGNVLVPEDQFTYVYNVINDYSTKVSTGMTTGDVSAQLRSALEVLQQLVEKLD